MDGHFHTHDPAYELLQRRLDMMPIGAPPHQALFDILQELFTPEECRLAAVMPLKPSSVRRLARNSGMPEHRVRQLLGVLLEKGLVVDMPRPDGRVLWFLNPAVIGFFEFTMMRVRTEIDQKRVAKLLWEYMLEDPKRTFFRMVADGPTFIARPLVHEDALEPGTFSEILDWERATEIVESGGSWAEGICHCRHVKSHLGKRCDFPMDMCLAMGFGADYLVRAGIAKRIDKSRAIEILHHAREHDAVQMADNVRKNPTFICNCCSCCCEMLEGLRLLRDMQLVVTSNWVAETDATLCTGCGKCAKKCPVAAIEMLEGEIPPGKKKPRKRAQVRREICLGCGVCHRHCKFGSLKMRPLAARVHTPANHIERIMRQAMERGKLQNLLFDDPTRLTHRVLGRALGTLLRLPPAQRALASEQVRSRFVGILLDGFSRTKASKDADV